MTIHEERAWTTRDKVEQATAFGRSVEWMTQHLGVTHAYIEAVWAGMDAAHREPTPAAAPHLAGKRRGKPRAECGTVRAYRQHIYYGERADEACLRANAERSRANKRLRKAKAA